MFLLEFWDVFKMFDHTFYFVVAPSVCLNIPKHSYYCNQVHNPDYKAMAVNGIVILIFGNERV